MKINSIVIQPFKGLNANKSASDVVRSVPINGYKAEFYNSDGSFKESVELKHTNKGIFFVLNEDKQGKNSYSMSIPYELYPMAFFLGAVNPLKFSYLTHIKDGKETERRTMTVGDIIKNTTKYSKPTVLPRVHFKTLFGYTK